MQEHTFLFDIVADLNNDWRIDETCKTWTILGQNPATGNVYKEQRRAIVRKRLAQYRDTLAASTPAQLRLNAKLLANELEQLYQQAAAHLTDLNADGLPLFHANMVRTLWDLTIGYAAASVIAYCQQDISLNLPASIRAEGKALAASAAAQGLTDADTFLGILNASTSTAGGRSKGQPQQKKSYNLIADYPGAEAYLKRLVPDYLNDDYSLQSTTNKADASIIAYTIACELSITTVWKYFEALWGVKDLRGAHKQAKHRNANSIRPILQLILRKVIAGVSGDTEDTDKVSKHLRIYQQ